MLQDFYAILKITPQASLDEIKLAYRKLAKQFHPDIVGNDIEKQVHFAQIKLAYETLSNPAQRQQYVEKRWLYKSEGKDFENYKPITVASIVIDFLALEKEAYYTDFSRINESYFTAKISLLFSETNCSILQNAKDVTANNTIIDVIIKLIPSLPLTFLPICVSKLKALGFLQNKVIEKKLKLAIQKRHLQHHIEKYKWVAILFILVALLVFIILWSRGL
jgi:hypothetical protein